MRSSERLEFWDARKKTRVFTRNVNWFSSEVWSRVSGFLLKANWRFYASPSVFLTSPWESVPIRWLDLVTHFLKRFFSCLKSQAAFPSVRFDSTFRGLTRVSAVITFCVQRSVAVNSLLLPRIIARQVYIPSVQICCVIRNICRVSVRQLRWWLKPRLWPQITFDEGLSCCGW